LPREPILAICFSIQQRGPAALAKVADRLPVNATSMGLLTSDEMCPEFGDKVWRKEKNKES
jgi:hypothetical protein